MKSDMKERRGKIKREKLKIFVTLLFIFIILLGALYFKTHVVKIIVVFKKGEYGKKNSIS